MTTILERGDKRATVWFADLDKGHAPRGRYYRQYQDSRDPARNRLAKEYNFKEFTFGNPGVSTKYPGGDGTKGFARLFDAGMVLTKNAGNDKVNVKLRGSLLAADYKSKAATNLQFNLYFENDPDKFHTVFTKKISLDRKKKYNLNDNAADVLAGTGREFNDITGVGWVALDYSTTSRGSSAAPGLGRRTFPLPGASGRRAARRAKGGRK